MTRQAPNSNNFSRIAIGTAQFGMDYGISNTVGKTDLKDIKSILQESAILGIRYIDTASAYGNAEEILGRTLPPDHGFRIVTKECLLNSSVSNENAGHSVASLFRESMERMAQNSLYALLGHDPWEFLSDKGTKLWDSLVELKKRGLVSKIGASVYRPDQLETILERFDLDIVQIPLNIFDQRFTKSDLLKTVKRRGVEIHARSCFLQGLLLMEPDKLSSFFDPVKGKIKKFQIVAKTCHRNPLDLALSFVLSVDEVDCVVVGVNNFVQFQEVCRSLRKPLAYNNFRKFAVDIPEIIEPFRWPARGGNLL